MKLSREKVDTVEHFILASLTWCRMWK